MNALPRMAFFLTVCPTFSAVLGLPASEELVEGRGSRSTLLILVMMEAMKGVSEWELAAEEIAVLEY